MKAKSLATITHTSRIEELNDSLRKLAKSHVLIGIDKDDPKNKREDGGPDNHLLGFVHELGSPAANIPARPFLVPGIKSAKKPIVSKLRGAMRAALHNDEETVERILEQVGMMAVSAVQNKITNGPFVPLSPRTIEQRHRSRMTQSKRHDETDDPEKIRPLNNTGAFRNAISYYIGGR